MPLHFNAADLKPVNCQRCGKLIAETDGATIVIRRDGYLAQFHGPRAVIQCHRSYYVNRRTVRCHAYNTVDAEKVPAP